MSKLLEDQFPTHYLPNVGRQVMRDGGAPGLVPAINALTAQLLNYGWQAPRLDYLKRVPRQGFDDGGVAAALSAIQNQFGGQRAPRAAFSMSDLIGTSNWQGQSPGAYTDAGGQKISAPYVSSMRGGYPVFNFPQPSQPQPGAPSSPSIDPYRKMGLAPQPSAPTSAAWNQPMYAAGGGVQGDVSYADDLPPIEIGRPRETPHAELPDMTIGRPRPNYDRGESMRAYEPTAWERAAQWMMGDKAPSPERRAMVEGLMGTSGLGDEKMSAPQAAHLAAHFAPPTALPAAALDVGQMLYKGEVDPIDAILAGVAGAPGKYAKAAVAGAAGALAYPKEAQAGPAARALEVARRLNPFGHYSPAAEAVAGIKQERGRVGDFLNALKSRGVTDAELQHSGVADAFAPDARVTRDELADYFHSKLPKIEERIYGGAPLEHKPREIELEEVHGDDIPSWKTGHYELGPRGKTYTIEEAGGGRGSTEYYLYGPKGDNLGDYRTFDAAVQAAHDALAGRDAARYADYALPGAQRYREVVMHLPPSGAGASQGFKPNHWDEPNVLAHLRLADRIEMPSGETNVDILRRMQEAVGAKDWRNLGSGAPHVALAKGLITPEEAANISRVKGWRSGFEDKPGLEKKLLHLEELQSDWGQKGRDSGFLAGNPVKAGNDRLYELDEAARAKAKELQERGVRDVFRHPEYQEITAQHEAASDALRAAIREMRESGKVLPGPYVTDTNQWTDLGLKRALKEAAEGGYDKLIWSPGDVHADRYNLAKHLKEVAYNPDTGFFAAKTHSGNNVGPNKVTSEKELAKLIGKDTAKRLLQQEKNNIGIHSLRGEDLSLGGHGMREFYDKVVPSRLSKLVKKLDPEAKIELFSHELPDTKTKGHVLHLTPALREAIKQGLPAFDKGGTVAKALDVVRKGPGGRLFKHFANEAVLGAANAAKQYARERQILPSKIIGVTHGMDAERIPEALQRWEGALPAPSLALSKTEAVPFDFGNATLVGRAHLAHPDEHTTVFPADAYTPRVPTIAKNEAKIPDALKNLAVDTLSANGGDVDRTIEAIRFSHGEHSPLGNNMISYLRDPQSLDLPEYIIGKNGRLAPTIENIIEHMRSKPLMGGESESPDTSLGLMRAMVEPTFKDMRSIQERRNSLADIYDPNNEDWTGVYHDAIGHGGRWAPHAVEPIREYAQRWPQDLFMRTAGDYIKRGRDWDAVKHYYPGLEDKERRTMDQFLSFVKGLEPSYFEAKPMRPVGVDEFRGAVLPQTDAGERAAQALVNHGMAEDALRFYNPRNDMGRTTHIHRLLTGDEGEGFDKGGAIRKALDAISRYREPKSQYIKDWKWRPLRDVQADIGTNVIPEHVQNFGRYMADISDKAATEGLDPEDLIKAYMITRSSIQREGRTPAKLAAQNALIRETDEPLVRPEGQMAEWLQTRPGVRFLNEARKGDLSQDVVDAAMRVMKPFGMSKAEPDAMDWARRNLPDQAPLVSDLVARARVGESSPAEWRAFTKDVRGIGPAKTGFIASLLGRGDLPTLDARQAILHTGMKNADVQDIMSKRSGRVGHEAVDRLAARQHALGFELPEELSPFYQHLAHHTVWDKVGDERTTHQDIIDAMSPRAAGGRAGYAGAGKVIRERLPIALTDALNRIFHIEHPDPDVVQNALRTVEKWRIPDRPNPDKSGYYNIGQSRAPSDVISQISAIRGLPLRKVNKMTWQDFYDQAQGGTLINFGGDRSNFGRMKGMNGVPFAWDVDLHAGPKYALEPSRGSVWANDPGVASGFQNAIMRAAEGGKPVYGVYTPMGPQAVNASHNMIDALLAQIPGRLASGELSHADARNFDAMLKAGEHAQSDKDVESLIKQMRDWPGLENAKEASEYMRPENVANGISGGNRRAFSLFMDTAPFKKQGFPMVGETRVGITDPALKFAPKSGAGHRIVRFNTDDLNPSSVAFKHSTYQQPTAGEYVGDVPLLPAHYVFGNALEKELQLLTRSGEVVHPLSADAQGRSSARKFIEEQNLLEPIDENFKRNIDLGLARKKAYGFREGGSIVDEALALLSRARRAA